MIVRFIILTALLAPLVRLEHGVEFSPQGVLTGAFGFRWGQTRSEIKREMARRHQFKLIPHSVDPKDLTYSGGEFEGIALDSTILLFGDSAWGVPGFRGVALYLRTGRMRPVEFYRPLRDLFISRLGTPTRSIWPDTTSLETQERHLMHAFMDQLATEWMFDAGNHQQVIVQCMVLKGYDSLMVEASICLTTPLYLPNKVSTGPKIKKSAYRHEILYGRKESYSL